MIINFHPQELPSKKGLEVIEAITKEGGHTIVRPSDKTKEEWQKIVATEEKLILVAPVYWWGASYEFDKWIQDVFSYGYAYEYQNGLPVGLLKGREFEMHMTHGTPNAYAEVMLQNIRLRLEKGIFGFNDAKVALSFYEAH